MSRYSGAYKDIDFKDKNTIKSLLHYRSLFESTGFTSDGSMYNKLGGSQNVYSDLIDIYADLDVLISECDLSEKNKRLLHLVESGYTISQIYTDFENYDKSSTIEMFNRVVERITNKEIEKEARNNDDIATEWRREKT